jgi:cell wall-associated NlpC family hydrolase
VIVALAGCATVPVPPPAEAPAPALAGAQPPGKDEPTGESEQDLPDAADEGTAVPGAAADAAPARSGLGSRLAARARTFLGQRGPFHAGGARFTGDCSGFVEAVYAAEGLDLRGAVQRAAPTERRGARGAWLAAQAEGATFGAEAAPGPGDLVFWHDTYDRNRNRKADDRFTHVGIVERVDGGTVHFIHRGGRGVARGVMTLARPHQATDGDGRLLNSTLRARSHPVKRGGLAAELFAGFARVGGPAAEPVSRRPQRGDPSAAPAWAPAGAGGAPP